VAKQARKRAPRSRRPASRGPAQRTSSPYARAARHSRRRGPPRRGPRHVVLERSAGVATHGHGPEPARRKREAERGLDANEAHRDLPTPRVLRSARALVARRCARRGRRWRGGVGRGHLSCDRRRRRGWRRRRCDGSRRTDRVSGCAARGDGEDQRDTPAQHRPDHRGVRKRTAGRSGARRGPPPTS